MSKSSLLLAAALRMSSRGDAVGAEQTWRQILAAEPANTAAARALGGMLADSGRFQEAADITSAALRAGPEDAELVTILGRSLYETGRLPQATAAFERAVAAAPRSAAAKAWLARCYTVSNRADEALALLEPLLQSHRRDALIRGTLGQAYWNLGRMAEALEHFEAAAAIKPTASAHSDLGWALYMQDRADEALGHFERTAALDPASASAASGRISVLTDRGERDKAYQLAQAMIGRGVADVQILCSFARLASTAEQRTTAARALELALQRTPSPIARSSMLLALGNLQDAMGDVDAAYSSYRSGNALIPSTFDAAALERSTQEIMDTFDDAAIERLPRSSSRDELPIFIVGMPRSGTSLVEQILASHPAVRGGGELEDLARAAAAMPGAMRPPCAVAFPRCVLSLSQQDVDSISQAYLSRLRDLGGGAVRVTDKMPRNSNYLGLIDLLFPGAKVIHCTRDALDTCWSCYTTPMSMVHAYRTRFDQLGAVYRAYRRLMDHWRGLVRVPVMEVRYEDLVADPQSQIRDLVAFAGLPWDDDCLHFHKNSRVVNTASSDQVRLPVYGSSVGRSRRYTRHLGGLIDALGDLN